MPFSGLFFSKLFLRSFLFLGQNSDLKLAISDVISGVSSAINKKRLCNDIVYRNWSPLATTPLGSCLILLPVA